MKLEMPLNEQMLLVLSMLIKVKFIRMSISEICINSLQFLLYIVYIKLFLETYDNLY